MMAHQGGNSVTAREYRKGNWTVSETMVLIEAKRMDDERRMKRTSGSSEGRSKPAELRWKWVEDYCWSKGCFRNQNQCNDKWDNLMRDYKKVREYERTVISEGAGGGGGGGGGGEGSYQIRSYWKLEKNERKDRNLPSNMLLQIYEALVEVVERRGGHQRMVVITTGDGGSAAAASSHPDSNMIGYVGERPITSVQPSTLPPLLQHQVSSPSPVVLPLPTPPPPPSLLTTQPPPPLAYSQQLPTVDSDTSEYSDSPAKRRKRSGGGEGTSGGATAGESTSQEVGNAISKSASVIAEAIQACKEREERRHRELLSLHERRLKIEESKTEIRRQGINGLVDAINNLATCILDLASHKNQTTSPK